MKSEPSQQEWQRLYEAAVAFKKAAPWEWMEEDELFGVRNPETGEIGWVSIMGQAGEHYALALYLGVEGLHGFWAIHEGGEMLDPTVLFEVPGWSQSRMSRSRFHAWMSCSWKRWAASYRW